MSYKIIFRERVKKFLKKIPIKDSEKIFVTIMNLSDNPYPHGYKKLKGREGFRVRQGNYRIIYEINKQEVNILILDIGDRKDIY